MNTKSPALRLQVLRGALSVAALANKPCAGSDTANSPVSHLARREALHATRPPSRRKIGFGRDRFARGSCGRARRHSRRARRSSQRLRAWPSRGSSRRSSRVSIGRRARMGQAENERYWRRASEVEGARRSHEHRRARLYSLAASPEAGCVKSLSKHPRLGPRGDWIDPKPTRPADESSTALMTGR